VLLAAGLACASAAAEEPATREITLRWRHPSGGAAGFRVYTRLYEEGYGDGVDVGLPEPRDGIYSYTAQVSDRDASWAVIRAYGSEGALSAPSNEGVYLLD